MRFNSSIIVRRLTKVTTSNSAHEAPQFLSCRLPGKAFISVRGPDAVKFLNGLITAKLAPEVVKKSLTTVNPDVREVERHPSISGFDLRRGNWGIYKEGTRARGPYISRFGTYSAFLNSKGKVLTDTVVYPAPLGLPDGAAAKYPEYLLQCDAIFVEPLEHLLQRHKLLQRVKIARRDDLSVWHVAIDMDAYPEWEQSFSWRSEFWKPMVSLHNQDDALRFARWFIAQFFAGAEGRLVGAYYDTRNVDPTKKSNIFYMVTTGDVDDIATLFSPQMVSSKTTAVSVPYTEVRRARLRRGVLEGVSELRSEAVLPLEVNFDLYEDAVSFDKGCYVGQELTARTHATGVLRKRCAPVIVSNSASLDTLATSSRLDLYTDYVIPAASTSPSPTNSPFASQNPRPRKKQPIGKLLCVDGTDGVALVKLIYIERSRSCGSIECYVTHPETGERVPIYIDLQNRPIHLPE
ncbi:ABR170Wp [Eremothecium gossypii ATCC 10895]|uniref:Iron-sulfur cluster assembly factor IBA57 homolog, mitochondrial n=1 Tax=Eremothecium gossypii (strain ATCC 10895 / CBS 109.51 / FGSC 9923 / NRRL Y-1056) TaxID=284811 RepID=CAF17_EREGS|nr:ABR170Wp [Eremothecium gossypii ATCC 10895]Q75D53.1 RecName: Full=Putative transferase CAF17, mitochondrial; Flags: Precursor [Eremothecium gossypii ATCC 10895]AAS50942.1 ABR170Wp [Eremothecium gossypii ATCC 10895]